MATVDSFERKLDDKRRLTIPAEIQASFKNGVVITRGYGKSIHLLPKEVWDEEFEPRLNGDLFDERLADLNVKFRLDRVEAKLDSKQGRLTLEQSHLIYAGIDHEVTAIKISGKYWRLMTPENANAIS